MRRFGVAVTMVVTVSLGLAACGGGAAKDTTAETCRKIDSLPRGTDATPEAWARVEAVRQTAGGEVAAILDEVIKAGKAGDYSNVLAPAARLQALCEAAGESLA